MVFSAYGLVYQLMLLALRCFVQYLTWRLVSFLV